MKSALMNPFYRFGLKERKLWSSCNHSSHADLKSYITSVKITTFDFDERQYKLSPLEREQKVYINNCTQFTELMLRNNKRETMHTQKQMHDGVKFSLIVVNAVIYIFAPAFDLHCLSICSTFHLMEIIQVASDCLSVLATVSQKNTNTHLKYIYLYENDTAASVR